MTGPILGITAALIAVMAFRQWFKLAFRQRNNNPAPFVLIFSVTAVTGIAAFALKPGIVGGIAAGIALLLSVFFLLSTYVGKQQSKEIKIIVGQPLPAFTAHTETGATFHSNELDGRPYLLKFFRGHW